MNSACRIDLRVLLLSITLFSWTTGKAGAQGALLDGYTHTGTIAPAGDVDTWTFTATLGDRIVLRIGEISQAGNFSPRLRLMNPNSVQQAAGSGAVAAEISVVATNSGTFTVLADDVAGTSATGTYRLTLAKSPGAISVVAGDEGGPMTNGVVHTGMIDVGDLDVWTFTAVVGESLQIRVGETVVGSTLSPAVWLYGPNGLLLDSLSGASVAEVATRATNSGTFTVVVGDFSGGYAGRGTYRLTMAKTADPIVVSEGDEGGPLTNGWIHTGRIDVGDLDVWNFSANTGESITVRMGEMVSGSALVPALWLYGPTGALLDSSAAGGFSSEVYVRATNSGTFTVVVGDYAGGYLGSGGYRITLAKTGGPIFVSPGDEGGPMTNAVTHTGQVDLGDLDVWSISANSGESLTVRIGELVVGSSLTPAIWLYGPTGVLLASDSGGAAAEVAVRATNSGLYMLVVGDYSGGFAGTGAYRMTLARTGSPIILSAGDEGGPMTNGVMHTGNLNVGELDVWSITANTGDNLTVRIGEIATSGPLTPALWLYGPTGVLMDSASGGVAAEVSVRATNSGTFTLVVGDYSGGYAGSGGYRLTLGRTGEPVIISAGDEGGLLRNGFMETGNLEVGDLDVWTFQASVGDSLVLRMGETAATSALTPALWLYGPNGLLLGADGSSAAAEVSFRATNSGVFTVVVGDFSGGYTGTGGYRLTLAKSPGEIFVSPGDEGGAMNGGSGYLGTLGAGDLDTFEFTACTGDELILRLEEVDAGSSLTPWLRLYGRTGVLIRSVSGLGVAEINTRATNHGTFTVVVSDFSGAYMGIGAYRLTVNGLSSGVKLCAPRVLGANYVMSGVGGTAGALSVIHTHTNVAAPLSNWAPIRTNQFDGFGVFNDTNVFKRAEPERYFRLKLP